MRTRILLIIAVSLTTACFAGGGELDATESARPRAFIPYRDIAVALQPADKSVLMDRKAFDKLLAAAQSNIRGRNSLELGQISRGQYSAVVNGTILKITGELTVESLSDKPVPIPLPFGQMGLTNLTLDAKPAAMGYDTSGSLVLIVIGKGTHTLKLTATATLMELSRGGMEFSLTLPQAVAGTMSITAPGDLEIHSTVPLGRQKYDKKSDRTTAELTLGGKSALAVVLLGNGRQETRQSILLSNSSDIVEITPASQILNSLQTVHVLSRGASQLQFTVPQKWTVTDVICPDMVKWSIVPICWSNLVLQREVSSSC